MTEKEVLSKLASYKDAIIKIKTSRDEFKSQFLDLKEKSYHTIKHLVEDNIEVKEKQIEKLEEEKVSTQNELTSLKDALNDSENERASWKEKFYEKEREIETLKQIQEKDRQLESASKEGFIKEIEKIIQEADEVLRE
jgi:predicted  nucleic acid-binding Zn-ribbon protein